MDGREGPAIIGIYISPVGWLAIVLSGVGGAALAVLVARVAGAAVRQRLDARRLGLGVALFAPAPLLMGGVWGPVAGFVFLAVAAAVLGKQGKGPAVERGEGSVTPLGWGALLTRGFAFATGGDGGVRRLRGGALSVGSAWPLGPSPLLGGTERGGMGPRIKSGDDGGKGGEGPDASGHPSTPRAVISGLDPGTHAARRRTTA